MFIKNRLLEIDEKDIFIEDKLRREIAIKNLASFIGKTTESFVFAINANWGMGKTTFVKMLKAYLKKEFNTQSIYFSAWENDFLNEPLLAILGEIQDYIDKNNKHKKIYRQVEKVKELAKQVTKAALPTLLKNLPYLGEPAKDILSVIGAELLNSYSKEKDIMQKFKEALNSLLDQIDKDRPFVIFIDELDRCRPLYAIGLLEKIKHVFNVDKLVFVLSIDKHQLSESIKSQYGNIDTDNYLRRFINLEFNLKNPSIEDFCDYLYTTVYKIDDNLYSRYTPVNIDSLIEPLGIIKFLSQSFKLSLRETEQLFTYICLISKTLDIKKSAINNKYFFISCVIVIYIEHRYYQQFFKLLNSNIHKNMIDEFLQQMLGDDYGKKQTDEIKAILLFLLSKKSSFSINDVLNNFDEEFSVLHEDLNNLHKEYEELSIEKKLLQDKIEKLNNLAKIIRQIQQKTIVFDLEKVLSHIEFLNSIE
ncbi:MAG: KAP family NTPase [Campylobacteraceae bacterium]|jgi:DNA polymerase III delta prime subunit|nr:KAP family NTPase [Campylobacteraceae bacterium]